MKRTMTIAAALLAAAIQAHAQDIMQTEKWEMQISESGHMSRLVFKDKEKNDTIPFFGTAGKAGPSFYVRSGGKDTVATWRQAGKRTWTSSLFGIACTLEYMEHTGNPAFKVTMENRSHVTFQPQKAGLKTGIDTYMDKYPDWFGKYFPTMMRNEKTHFYGYLQNPAGHIVAIVSEQPVASWSVDYNLGYMDPSPHWFMGHRIESLNLDLLNALPLPERHPQDLYELSPGEKMEWTISFVDVESSEDLEKRVASAADIPVIRAERTSYVPGETATFSVYGEKPEITVLDRNGENALPASIKDKGCFTEVQVMLPEPGLYTVTAQSGERTAEGILSARHSWKWIFDNARDAVLEYHQKPTSHAESWYGFYTGFIAAKHFPDEEKDRKIREYFDLLFNKLHDTDRMVPLYYESRIQNTSTTIGMLVDKFECYGDTADLMAASRLADWLMEKWQREDGAYHNHGIIYTSVIYVAKSMLELSIAEKKAAAEGNSFAEAGSRHYESAKRAIDQLVASKGNFETEGQMTFEDGMIS